MLNFTRPHLATCAFVLALAAGPALAQQAGHYVGTTSDGHDIDLTLSVDETTGGLVLTGMGMGFTALCPKSGNSLGYGIGAGAYAPLTGNTVNATLPYSNLYATISATFDGAGNVRGKASGDIPLYIDSSTSFKSENCGSGKMKFSGVLTTAESAAHSAKTLAAGVATVTAQPAQR